MINPARLFQDASVTDRRIGGSSGSSGSVFAPPHRALSAGSPDLGPVRFGAGDR
jgi:hypothetical protein